MLRRSNNAKEDTNNNAQSILEYSLVLGLVAMVLSTMGPLIQRSLKGMIMLTADQIGLQANSDQKFQDNAAMVGTNSFVNVSIKKDSYERVGIFTYEYEDSSYMTSSSLINMGFQEGEH